MPIIKFWLKISKLYSRKMAVVAAKTFNLSKSAHKRTEQLDGKIKNP